MELITPQFGLFFWTLLIFLTVFLVLRYKAWPVILGSLREREDHIRESLKAAESAREEMKRLQSENEQLLNEARQEKTRMLKEAQESANEIVQNAKAEANKEGQNLLEKARHQIEQEKASAIAEIKVQAGELAVDIAEQLLRKELETKEKQTELAKRLADQVSFN
jgi:ATP synthase, F0 subunit b